MQLSACLILLAVATAVMAWACTVNHWVGGVGGFLAYQNMFGNDDVVQIYITCIEGKNSGLIESTSAECAGRVLSYLFEAVVAVGVGDYVIGLVENA